MSQDEKSLTVRLPRAEAILANLRAKLAESAADYVSVSGELTGTEAELAYARVEIARQRIQIQRYCAQIATNEAAAEQDEAEFVRLRDRLNEVERELDDCQSRALEE